LSDIGTLIGYTAPSNLPDDSRIKPQEFTTVTLKCTLTGYKQEDDSDYHLTIQDSNGNGMIAEIPYEDSHSFLSHCFCFFLFTD
jgi:hypothetical protein